MQYAMPVRAAENKRGRRCQKEGEKKKTHLANMRSVLIFCLVPSPLFSPSQDARFFGASLRSASPTSSERKERTRERRGEGERIICAKKGIHSEEKNLCPHLLLSFGRRDAGRKKGERENVSERVTGVMS